jgi:hypothetical protein
MGATGPVTPSVLRKKTDGFARGGAESSASGGDRGSPPRPPAKSDPDLATVIAAWGGLSTAIRAGILAMVRAAGGAK